MRKQLTSDQIRDKLRQIKLSIIAASTDTIWLTAGGEPMPPTVCEAIDDILLSLGDSAADLEVDYYGEEEGGDDGI